MHRSAASLALGLIAALSAPPSEAAPRALKPDERSAVEDALRRAVRPARLIRLGSVAVSADERPTICGLARLAVRRGHAYDMPFTGTFDARRFTVMLMGRTGRDDFTVRNLCSAAGAEW